MRERDLQALDAYFVAERMCHLEEYREFRRILGVSALPSHREDMLRAADRVAGALRKVRVPMVEVMPTAGHPVGYNAWPAAQSGTWPSITCANACRRRLAMKSNTRPFLGKERLSWRLPRSMQRSFNP
jgi:hypothetical protein